MADGLPGDVVGPRRARYVEIDVVGTLGESLVIARLASGEEVHLPRDVVEAFYVPVLSTTAHVAEESA